MEFREGDRVPVKMVSGTGAVTLGARPVGPDGNEFSDGYVRLWTGNREFERADPPDVVTAEMIRTDSEMTQGRIVDEDPNVGRVYREWRRTLEARGDRLDDGPSGTRDSGTSGARVLDRESNRDDDIGEERPDGEEGRTRTDRGGYEDEWKRRKSDSMRDLL